MPTPKLDAFTTAYIECALWSSSANRTDDDDTSLDSLGYGVEDIAPEALQTIISDCTDFQETNAADIEASESGSEQAGHDFWLTRNRHGAGFWDRDYRPGTRRDALLRLTEAAHAYGSCDLYLGDDELIYLG